MWAEAGNTAKALDELKSIIAESRKCGYIAAELEARLALGELQLRTGKTTDGLLNLSALEREANARGYLLIANKVSAARKMPKRDNQKILSLK